MMGESTCLNEVGQEDMGDVAVKSLIWGIENSNVNFKAMLKEGTKP